MKLKDLLVEGQFKLGDEISKVTRSGGTAGEYASSYSHLMYTLSNKINAENFDKFSKDVIALIDKNKNSIIKNITSAEDQETNKKTFKHMEDTVKGW